MPEPEGYKHMLNFKKMLLGLVLLVNLVCEAESANYRDVAKFLGFAAGTTFILAGRKKFSPLRRTEDIRFINAANRKWIANSESDQTVSMSHTNQTSGAWVRAQLVGLYRICGFTWFFGKQL